MFDRGKPSEAASPSTSPDRKMAPTQGSYMNNEQFCLSPSPHLQSLSRRTTKYTLPSLMLTSLRPSQ